ncbi:MAG TPA: RluA family pseudouridine synthase [bacterium]|nr:RluA family pseudouridine synthase [bacterium]
MRKLVVTEKMVGVRLDKMLSDKFPKRSRSEWKKIIDIGKVKIDGRIAKSHHKVNLDEVVEWQPMTKKQVFAAKQKPVSEQAAINAKIKMKIVAENEDYLVINKPAGLLVHDAVWPPRRPTVAEAIIKKYPEVLSVGENPTRPGIVHRLDKDVSGLMVIPRSQAMFKTLKRQFQYRTVKKYYTALVYGTMSKAEGVIDFNLARSSDGRKMAARPVNQEGKKAITEYKVIREWQNYTLLKVIIKTGRTHQIRAHFGALGHALVGDDWYGTNKNKLKNKELALGRVFLMASELSFLDLEKKRQTFSAKLPKQLNDLLKIIK